MSHYVKHIMPSTSLLPSSLPPPQASKPTAPVSAKRSSSSSTPLSRRAASLVLSSSPLLLRLACPARAEENEPAAVVAAVDDPDQEEERVVSIFRDASPSVVFIKDLELRAKPGGKKDGDGVDETEGKVVGTGSGFVWDKAGHIVTNYHVIEKFATDQTGLRRCKVYLEDSNGNSFSREGKLIGLDPAYDLAVLKVDVEGDELKPALIGTSNNLRVGQGCYAIGNPYGYEHTLTTGVVSGLGREIPSPNGRAIRGAIQTDAAINAGNSGGPLMDSHGHVIGVNTATFTRKGTGMSSGVNFAIPIDAVVRTVPYLIVYGTSVSNRY